MLARPLAVGFLALLLLAPAARSEDGPALTVTSLGAAPETLPARAGAWLPLEVTIRSGGAAEDVLLRCRRAGPGVRSPVLFERRVSLAAHANRVEPLLFFLPEDHGEALVELVPENAPTDRPLASASFAWKESEEPLLLGLSRDGSAHRLTSRVELGGIARAPARALALKPEELPASAEALLLATAIFVVNADLRALSSAQGAALRGYVEAGGQLVLVFSGSTAEYRGSELEALLPCEVRGAEPRAAPALGAFEDDAPEGAPLVAEVRPLPGAVVLLGDAAHPLAVRRRTGAGAVTYLAFDPTRRRSGRLAASLAAWLLAMKEPRARAFVDEAPRDSVFAHLAREAARGKIVRAPPFLLVGAILLAYIALAVPVNYGFWRRRGRLERTAPTAAFLALGFAGALYALGFAWKGARGLSAESTLIETAAGERAGRATAACGVFAPERRLARIEARLAAAPVTAEGAAIVRIDGAGGPARVLESVELDQWALRLFALSGPAEAPCVTCDLALGADGRCRGTVKAPAETALAGAFLLLGGKTVLLGDIAAGATRAIEAPFVKNDDLARNLSTHPEILDRRLVPGDRELDAVLQADVAADATPWLATDFAAPRTRAARAIAVAVPLRLAPGPVDLAPGILHPRVVAASPDAVGMAADGVYSIEPDKKATLEWTLPFREGFQPAALAFKIEAVSRGGGLEHLRMHLVGPGGTIEVGPREPTPIRRDVAKVYDPRTGAVRLEIENRTGVGVEFREPTLGVTGTLK